MTQAWFVQLVPTLKDYSKHIILSGVVLAETRAKAEEVALDVAGEYQAVKELGIELMVYTLMKVGGPDGRLASFGVHSDVSFIDVNQMVEMRQK